LYFDHKGKIIESYKKLLKVTSNNDEPNKKIMDIVLDMYAYAYEGGELEYRERVPTFHKELYEQKKLLKQAHKELQNENNK
jgi:hypothetical protein